MKTVLLYGLCHLALTAPPASATAPPDRIVHTRSSCRPAASWPCIILRHYQTHRMPAAPA